MDGAAVEYLFSRGRHRIWVPSRLCGRAGDMLRVQPEEGGKPISVPWYKVRYAPHHLDEADATSLLVQGSVVEFLVEAEGLPRGWSEAVVIEADADASSVFLFASFSDETASVPRVSLQVRPRAPETRVDASSFVCQELEPTSYLKELKDPEKLNKFQVISGVAMARFNEDGKLEVVGSKESVENANRLLIMYAGRPLLWSLYGKYREEFEVESRFGGYIVGKNGESLKAIESKYQVKVDLEKPPHAVSSTDYSLPVRWQKVVISGFEDQVKHARKECEWVRTAWRIAPQWDHESRSEATELRDWTDYVKNEFRKPEWKLKVRQPEKGDSYLLEVIGLRTDVDAAFQQFEYWQNMYLSSLKEALAHRKQMDQERIKRREDEERKWNEFATPSPSCENVTSSNIVCKASMARRATPY